MKSAPLLALALILTLCLPAIVHADASVYQDSCVVVGRDQVRIYFSIYNLNLPRAICSFTIVAKDQPQQTECEAVDCGAAQNWSCVLNSEGGADFNALAATPPATNCIEPGSVLGGFYITLDPGFCCYRAVFADAAGVEFVQDYVCFTLCQDLPVEQKTWGNIKKMYDR